VRPNEDFYKFSPEHTAAMALIVLAALAFVAIARFARWRHLIKPLNWTLAVIAIGHEAVWIIGAIVLGHWHYSWGLPLQLCDLAIFGIALCLIRHVQWAWELAYFWGLGGSLQAILTPDLGVSFPDIVFIKFFLSHGCTVAGVIYLAVGLRRPIAPISLVRVFLITNIYGGLVLIFNWAAGTNYMYLNHRPTQPSLLDMAGQGLWYYVGLEVMLILSLMFYYLPYLAFDRKNKNKTTSVI